MKEIPLTQGKVALVDDGDFEWLSKFKWHALKRGNVFYAGRSSPRDNGKKRMIIMHREILGLKPGDPGVDHRDGNGLNNRRENLRRATKSQNAMNQQKTRGTSRFKGVRWHKDCKKWTAEIKFDGKKKHLGLFNTEEEAAKAYNRKAEELFGEYANLNELERGGR